MTTKGTNTTIKFLVAITYVVMVAVNALANIIPINGQTTGEISDKYSNLFAPAGITFSIWGLIYLLLLGYTLYQFGFFQKRNQINSDLLNRIGIYFSISSIANSLWIFAWHYEKMSLAMSLMIIILFCLIQINQLIIAATLSTRDKIFVQLPFSVYFGWITIATIANVTTLLVSIGWDGFGLSDVTWTIIILLVGTVIGMKTTIRNQDIAYGFVILWAYIGILIKHLSETGFDGQYPLIITTCVICLVIISITLINVIKSVTKRNG